MAQFCTPDYSKNPVMLLTMTGIEPTMEEFEAYLSEMEKMYSQYKNFVLIFDATKSKYASGEIRARQAKWIKDHEKQIKENCIGMIYVLPNVMIEMVFKCIVTFSPLPVKYATVRSLEAAMKESEKFLAVAK